LKFMKGNSSPNIGGAFKGAKVISGTTHPKLCHDIGTILGISTTSTTISTRSNGETSIVINESLREMDVFIVQSTAVDPNNSIMELLILADAAKRASAKRITAIIPCFGYARQDKKEKSRVPISAKLIANMLEVAGINRVVSLDLHSQQLQGFFNIAVDNLHAEVLLMPYIEECIPGNKVIVSPGVSAVPFVKKTADRMAVPLCIAHFGAVEMGEARDLTDIGSITIVGNVEGKVAVILSDIADTFVVEAEIARTLIQKGATRVYVVATHAILSADAIATIENSPITELVLTNSVSLSDKIMECKKISVLDIAPLFAEGIRRLHLGEQISYLFEEFMDGVDRLLLSKAEITEEM